MNKYHFGWESSRKSGRKNRRRSRKKCCENGQESTVCLQMTGQEGSLIFEKVPKPSKKRRKSPTLAGVGDSREEGLDLVEPVEALDVTFASTSHLNQAPIHKRSKVIRFRGDRERESEDQDGSCRDCSYNHQDLRGEVAKAHKVPKEILSSANGLANVVENVSSEMEGYLKGDHVEGTWREIEKRRKEKIRKRQENGRKRP